MTCGPCRRGQHGCCDAGPFTRCRCCGPDAGTLTTSERELLRPVSGCCAGCHHHGQAGANDEAWLDVCEAVDGILAARLKQSAATP